MTEIHDVLRRVKELRGKMVLALVAGVLATLVSLYDVDLFPPGLEGKTETGGAASTEVLVDFRRSALANAGPDITALSTRVPLYARLVDSAEVRRAILGRTGISSEQLDIDTEAEGAAPLLTVGAESANLAARRENPPFQLRVTFQDGLPLLTFSTETPDPQSAELLANVAAAETVAFLDRRARQEPASPAAPAPGTESDALRRALTFDYRQLTPAEGAPIASERRPLRSVLLGVVVAIGVGLGILFIASLADELRAMRGRMPRHDSQPQ